MTLTAEHRHWLEEHGVDVELAEQLGVRTALKPSHLPPDWQRGLGRHVPGVVFPWTSPDGKVSPQLRPDNPRDGKDGKPVKYEFQRDSAPVLWCVRPNPGAPILIAEGSKQCLVAAEFAPPEFEVYGLAGCWGFLDDGTPISDLAVTEDRAVTVIFDADAGKNPDVFDAAERFTAALEAEGAASVKWVRLTDVGAGSKSGLDDLLIKRGAKERRGPYLARLIAKAKDTVADARPKPKPKVPGKLVTNQDPDRPQVDVEDDPLIVTDKIERHLRKRWDGTTIFCHGEALSELVVDRMRPLTKNDFTDLVIRTITPVVDVRGQIIYQMPAPSLMGTVHTSRARNFTPLDQITNLPIFRFDDGSICQEPGYDARSRTYLVDSPMLEKIDVPETPDAEDVARAVHLLDEWFYDMPFPDAASRTNVKALVLTYFIRSQVARVPLAVIDGLQAGSGKGLIANCISLVVRGKPATLRSFSESDEENRKALLAAYRSGETAVVWDEAHRLHGANLAQALTEPTRTDRVLGVSDEVTFPNRMVWTALGNQVQLVGDIERRCYPIHVVPTGPNPEDRPEDDFLHPQLEDWTERMRPELVSACLILIRAWWQAGRPTVKADFGSFEDWQRIVGGILANAGVPDFLANLKTWRKSANFEAQQWALHMDWLVKQFGEMPFTTRQVKQQAQQDLGEYEGPPGMQDVAGAGFSQDLGKVYKRRVEVWCDGWKLAISGTAHGGANKWVLVPYHRDLANQSKLLPLPNDPGPSDSSPDVGNSGANGVNGDRPLSTTHARTRERAHTPARARARAGSEPVTDGTVDTTPATGELIFDLETGGADDLYSAEKGTFVRLGGHADAADPDAVTITTDWAALSAQLRGAKVVSGHNIMRFDLPALTRHHPNVAPDIQELVRDGRAFDTLLAARHLDPPMAKDKGVDAKRRHDLDSLGKRLFGDDAGKAGNLKALAKKHGGFDQIPLDDEEYVAYLKRDVTLNAQVYRHQQEALAAESEASRAYLTREHRVAAVAAQISLNGFRVDLELLQERLDHNARLRSAALNRLHGRYDIPLEDEKGKPYKAPLATTAGKAALCEALVKAGLKEGAWWRTETSRDIALSAEAMKFLYNSFHHLPAVRDIARMVITVVGLRSVYETVEKWLVGDRVHCSISMHQATGRWSTTKPGLTVFGKRGGRHHEREIFLAEPGHVLIAVDLSQIDMRAIGGLSGDRAYINMFSTEDPHAEIARLLFGDPAMRELAKPINHGWSYGRGVKAISDSNDLDPALVRKFDTSMRERFPRLVEWQTEVRAWAESGELLDNGWGRPMRPDTRRAHTQGPALMGQGCARDLMMEGLLRLPAEVLPMLRAQIHDEVVLSVPAADAAEIQQVVIDALSFDWTAPSGAVVPIVAEGGPVDRINWGSVYDH